MLVNLGAGGLMTMVEPDGHDVALTEFHPERDLHLVESWLRRPHVSQWWGDPDEALLEVTARPHEGGDALIVVDGVPTGYIRWQIPSREELDAAGLSDLPRDVIDIDIAVGEAELLGLGIGSRAVALLRDRLVESGATTVIIATSVDNLRAIRAYEKAGFVRRRRFIDTDGGVYWLFAFEPPLG